MHAKINSWIIQRTEKVARSLSIETTILIIGPKVFVSCSIISTLNQKLAATTAIRKLILNAESFDSNYSIE
jgi:hypothetical protein